MNSELLHAIVITAVAFAFTTTTITIIIVVVVVERTSSSPRTRIHRKQLRKNLYARVSARSTFILKLDASETEGT